MSDLSELSDMEDSQIESDMDSMTVSTRGTSYPRTEWSQGDTAGEAPWWRMNLVALFSVSLVLLGLIGAASHLSIFAVSEEQVADGDTTTNIVDLSFINTTFPAGGEDLRFHVIGVRRPVPGTLRVRTTKTTTLEDGTKNGGRQRKAARTAGLIWPLPQSHKVGSGVLFLDAVTFHLTFSASVSSTSTDPSPTDPSPTSATATATPRPGARSPCPLVERAMRRYRERWLFGDCAARHSSEADVRSARAQAKLRWDRSRHGDDASLWGTLMEALIVNLRGPCEDSPHENMDESYHLVLSSSRPSVLTSRSAWGLMRGLESFSQLVRRYNATHFWANESEVVDAPRFSHRGLLLNTGSHFLPVATIVEALDAMALNKMNVLHWRIVDEYSFPFVSQAFPDLSLKGAYNPETLVYQPSDVDRVINEARDRGIRIVPELGNPGRTKSWGRAFPHLLAKCEEEESSGSVGSLNPTQNATFEFLDRLLAEVARLFPDGYLHLGGDELGLDCWKSDMEVAKYLKKMNISGSYGDLLRLYYKRLFIIVNKFRKSPVFWQDVFTNKVRLPRHAVVQSRHQESGTADLLSELTAKGHRVLVSHCWLMEASANNQSWPPLHQCEPHDFQGTAKQKALVVGGEVGVWDDSVDRTNLIASTWPAASLAAERLWSPRHLTDLNTAMTRLQEQRCRMLRRGLEVQPLTGPGFCECDHVA
ncbi:beta-hexosaminidase subunit beta-like isoform X2 [Dermacentor albipictus]|uniref:beta-hexosaminidase subunit beta-like isoform X2 n=1 Tax=Dermacentor albipictus TaxID=60249 RepID=UPI0031FDD5B2